MIDLAPDIEGLEVVVEIQGVDEATAEELRSLFDGEDEDVVFAHAFGGKDALSLFTALTPAALGKLIGFWNKLKTKSPTTPKTSVKIGSGKGAIAITGFTQPEVEALLASSAFQKMVRAARTK